MRLAQAMRAIVAASAALAATALPHTYPAAAQTYPSKLIKIVAPFPAGGLADVLARGIGEDLQKALGQTVLVENRAGAGGNTGALAVATAEPDGYTLLLSSAGILTINEFIYAKMPFDPAKAFAPITVVAEMAMLVAVHPKVGVTDLKSFLAKAKAEPGKLNFGSPGNGTTGHLGLVLLMRAGDLQIAHVPYRGAAPALQDLVAGQIDGVVDNPPTLMSQIKAGAIRALAIGAKQRLAALPDVPTAAEAGLPNFEATSWFALVAPAGTPKPIIDRLHVETVKSLRSPAMDGRFGQQGAKLTGNTPDEFARFIVAEREKWGKVLSDGSVKMQ